MFLVKGVYFPSSLPALSYEKYTSTVEEFLTTHSGQTFIFCGDFNILALYDLMIKRSHLFLNPWCLY